MIDTHAHLGTDAADVLERAHAAGVTRVVAVATTVDGARDVLALADQHDGVFACLGVHPHEAGAPGDLTSCARCSAIRRPSPSGRPGLDYYRDYAPHDAQQRIFEKQLALARRPGKPVVIHTRAADDDTRTRLVGHEGTVVLHCFSSPRSARRRAGHGWYVSFAGNVTYKNAYDLRDCARRVPADRLLVETDSPYLAPQAVRGRRNEPALRRPHLRLPFRPRAARTCAHARRRERKPRVRARMRLVARKDLGQHFLVDENILRVIERLAELAPADVVLEIGPGLGVLTRFLAERVAHVHAVEVDRRLEEHLAPIERTSLHWGDALASTFAPWIRRRTSSSRTFRTTSRRRSSPKASRSSSSSCGA